MESLVAFASSRPLLRTIAARAEPEAIRAVRARLTLAAMQHIRSRENLIHIKRSAAEDR